MSMSVLCLLTGQTARAVRDDPALADVVPRLLDEANSVAQSCFPEVKRVTRTGPAPDHKPSILQDYELGRAMEIDVLVRAPAAFARGRTSDTDARPDGSAGDPAGAGQGTLQELKKQALDIDRREAASCTSRQGLRRNRGCERHRRSGGARLCGGRRARRRRSPT